MPDPRIRRTRPHGARHGRPVRGTAPDGGAEVMEEAGAAVPPEAVPAPEAELEAEAPPAADDARPEEPAGLAAAVAAAAVVAESPDEPESPDEAEPEAEAESPDEAEPEAETAPEAGGWFREEPLEDGPDAEEASWMEAEAAAEVEAEAEAREAGIDEPAPPEPALPGGEDEAFEDDLAGATVVAAAVGEAEVATRDRDRPVVTAGPAGPPPRRGRRLRGFVIGVVTIVAVAAVGFVAGLMLPTLLPGPGIASGSAEPSATASETPVTTPSPAVEPTATSTPEPTPEETPTPTPASTPITYVVKRGDSLLDIAERFGVTVAAIRRANNIDDPNLIQIGQRLTIPSPRATPAP